MEQSTTSDYQRGYQAGRIVTTFRSALEALGWDDWGEPANEWQRGFVDAYEDRHKTRRIPRIHHEQRNGS